MSPYGMYQPTRYGWHGAQSRPNQSPYSSSAPYQSMPMPGDPGGPFSGNRDQIPMPPMPAPIAPPTAAAAIHNPYTEWLKNRGRQSGQQMPGPGMIQKPVFNTPGQSIPIQMQGQKWQQGWRVGSDGLWHPPEQGAAKSPYAFY